MKQPLVDFERIFLMGRGEVLVGIMPGTRRGEDGATEEAYAVTVSRASRKYEVGALPSDEAEEVEKQYFIDDECKILIVVSTLEWACTLANAMYEANTPRFTPEKMLAKIAEADAKKADGFTVSNLKDEEE